jgi:hypothetical protein
METFDWMGFAMAISAMGMASSALYQIASLKQEIKLLTDELRRRGLLEQTVGAQDVIVPGSRSKWTGPQ